MDCKDIKKKMEECLKEDCNSRECKTIINSWKFECENESENEENKRTWVEYFSGKKEEPELKDESKETEDSE
jgi:hypothetical protein